jgi:type IV pilus assembly protein PilB
VARARIGELLVEAKTITQAQLDDAVALQGARTGEPRKLGQVLVELGYVTETQLTQTLSLQLAVPWVSLYHIDFSRQLLNMVPREVAERYCAVPIFVRSVKKKATLYVAMDDPTNEGALESIAGSAGIPVKPMIASPSDIRSAIRVYYGGSTHEIAAAPVAQRVLTPVPVKFSEPPVGGRVTNPGPPPVPAKPPPPPVTGRAPLPTVVDSMEILAIEAATPAMGTSAVREGDGPRPPMPSEDSPDADPELEVLEYVPTPTASNAPRMVALTLLDGTTLNLPARASIPPKREGSVPPSAGGISDQLTARDLVSALRAVAHGADASEILGSTDWQAMFAALLSVMLKKNLIADWEFVEELRNI